MSSWKNSGAMLTPMVTILYLDTFSVTMIRAIGFSPGPEARRSKIPCTREFCSSMGMLRWTSPWPANPTGAEQGVSFFVSVSGSLLSSSLWCVFARKFSYFLFIRKIGEKFWKTHLLWMDPRSFHKIFLKSINFLQAFVFSHDDVQPCFKTVLLSLRHVVQD